MQIPLLYGRGRRMISLPDDAEITLIRKPAMPFLSEPDQAVVEALRHPVFDPGKPQRSFAKLAAGRSSACIAICDITRPVPNRLFLRPLIQTMIRAGIPANRITVLIATGLHRPNLGDELAELIGDPWVLENVHVVNHDALADKEHVNLGRTSTRQTPVKIDRRFVEADLRIATGLVEPHFMAGYSGGRKVVAPGLAHVDTITTFHNHAFMSDPAATNCNLAGNPLHEEQLQIIEMIGGAFGLNTVLDEHRRLSMVNFGEITASHREAVAFIAEYCRVAVPEQFATVVTSAAGYPLDKTYYQTVKGMVGPVEILRPGGNLIVVSECGDGLGSPAYVEAQRQLIRLGEQGFLQSIRNKPLAAIDEWQTQMQTKATHQGKVMLASSLSAEEQMLTGVRCIDDVDEAIRKSIQTHDCNKVAIVPEGPYVVPYLAAPGDGTLAEPG